MKTSEFPADSLFPEEIETERLRFERFCAENVPLQKLHQLLSVGEETNEALKHMPMDPHQTLKETVDYVEMLEDSWGDGEIASYVIRPGESEPRSGEFAGLTTLEVDWNRRLAEWGVVLRKPFWGRGCSTERARMLVRLVFDHLGLEVIEVNCSVENERAKRSADKYVNEFGGHYVGVLHNKHTSWTGDPVDCHRYTITRSEYEERTE